MKRLALVAVACTLALAGCSAASTDANTQAAAGSGSSSEASGAAKAKLTVTAKNKAAITYGTGGGMSQTEKKGTWTKTVDLKDFDVVSVSVTNGDLTTKNEVTCKIEIGGKVVAEQSGTGTASIASCSATYTG